MTEAAAELELIAAAGPGAAGDEAPPPGEAGAITAVTAMIEARVTGSAAGGQAHRDAHPKEHGCVRARFAVLPDLPPAMRVGVFAEPRTFQAWIRFSNGSGTPRPDAVGDGRGMAIKLLGVAGSPSSTQDLIMINHPTFFVKDAVDYVAFQSASNPLRFFFPGLNPLAFRLRELWNASAITRRKVANPLNTRYWSMTPYLYGETPCKYSVRPTGTPSSFIDTASPDFLRDNLARQLSVGEAAFDFQVQLRTRPAMPIEDPRIEWDEGAAPFVTVARIVIPAQEFATPERDAFGEALSFTPWHGLAEHRPLGGINRVRRSVYEAISRLRHTINGQSRSEPRPD